MRTAFITIVLSLPLNYISWFEYQLRLPANNRRKLLRERA